MGERVGQDERTGRMIEKLRWKTWGWLIKLPGICPANAHSVLIVGSRRTPRVDASCREDFARNGVCWCGKLRESWDGDETP